MIVVAHNDSELRVRVNQTTPEQSHVAIDYSPQEGPGETILMTDEEVDALIIELTRAKLMRDAMIKSKELTK